MRGTADSKINLEADTRITPACAGNRGFFCGGTRGKSDHPRVCGEQLVQQRGQKARKGSPPRVRGTAPAESFLRQPKRITPACAGNRPRRHYSFELLQDHPRVCGEQFFRLLQMFNIFGSPPRVRGTASYHSMARLARRITPACAGNSFTAIYSHLQPWDHPRVCGEQSVDLFCEARVVGSPPRVRGTDILNPQREVRYRITPACAGNSKD